MLAFLLKSTACLGIFLAFYKLLLEKESVHHFKRFYLLGALIASLIIPSIVFVEYVEVAQNSFSETLTAVNATETSTILPVDEGAKLEWGAILWSVYILGVLGFGFRFLRNLGQIWLRIRKNPKSKHHFITRVLLAQQLPPHTFFSYIFLNKKQYEAQNIPEEVLLHEETHARQRHSLDILFIELAQVIFWFNPFVYPLKSCVRLNHEFLADRAVINKSLNLAHYQNTLLSYLSHDHFEQYQSTGIANAINYSSIKKRFTVMKTNTSKTSFVFRSLLVLPLTALLLSGFAEKRQIEIDNSSDQIIGLEGKVSPSDLKTYNELAKKYNAIPIEKRVIPLKDLNVLETIYRNMDKVQKEIAMPFPECLPESQQSASREEMKEYNALAKKYNEMDRNHMVINKKEVIRLKVIYGKMSEKQRADAEPFPNFPPPPPAPDATKPPKAPSAVKKVKGTQPNLPPAPPVPPTPPTPMEHIKKMAAKGATFMYNGKEISAKKAIEVIQNNHKISIDSREANGDHPVVKLSTEPIVIEN